jgi:cell wall-associated NlpC family hydrolase
VATPRPALGHALDRSIAGLAAGATRLSRTRRRAGVVLGATAAACAVLTALPGTASADPSPAELTQEVADASHQLEVVSEQVNQARTVLEQQQTAVTQADQAAAAADARLHAMDGQIRQLARTAYTTGDVGRVDVLLSSRSAGDLIAQMGTLDAIAGHQTAVVKQVSDAAAAARAARASAQAAAFAAQRTIDEISAEQAQLQSQVADYRRQYDALTAEQQQVVVQRVTGTAVAVTGNPAPAAAAAPLAAAAPVAAPVAASGSAAAAVRTALAQVGKPYAWGAAGPGAFDCSGLTQYSWAAAGVALPHSSSAQSRMGTPVPLSALQPGDLVFFYSPVSHVAMYVGGGNIVHASTEGQPVKVVSLASVPGATSARRLG